MKKGYIVHYWGEVAVEEVSIFSEFVFDGREYYALQKQHMIWSSVGGPKEKPNYQNTHPLAHMLKNPQESDFQYERIFLSLDEVKKEIRSQTPKQIEEAERLMLNCKRNLEALNNLDLDTIPKEDYTSLFTGKPT
mgnify:CR=1 FL=1|jgi:hypothetical protein